MWIDVCWEATRLIYRRKRGLVSFLKLSFQLKHWLNLSTLDGSGVNSAPADSFWTPMHTFMGEVSAGGAGDAALLDLLIHLILGHQGLSRQRKGFGVRGR